MDPSGNLIIHYPFTVDHITFMTATHPFNITKINLLKSLNLSALLLLNYHLKDPFYPS